MVETPAPSPQPVKSSTQPPPKSGEPFSNIIDLMVNVARDKTPERMAANLLLGAGEMLSGERYAHEEFMKVAQDLPPELQVHFVAGFATGMARQMFKVEGEEVTPNFERRFNNQCRVNQNFLQEALEERGLADIKVIKTDSLPPPTKP